VEDSGHSGFIDSGFIVKDGKAQQRLPIVIEPYF